MTTLSEKDIKIFKKWLKSHLAYGPTTVIFTKKDGTERVMNCTTNLELVPPEPIVEAHATNTDNPIDFPIKKEKKVNEEVMRVYDLDAKGWRSFRWDSIKQIRFTLE
jgi:hypothetical protein